jgi:hypothetical protein
MVPTVELDAQGRARYHGVADMYLDDVRVYQARK